MDTDTPVRKYEIIAEKERLRDMTVEDLLAVEEGHLRAMLTVLAQFMHDGTDYIPPEEARAILLKLKIWQLSELADVFRGKAERVAVPLTLKKDSD